MKTRSWVKTVKWEKRSEQLLPSRFKLLEEHLRRVALWTDHLETVSFFPFGDLAGIWAEKLALKIAEEDWTLVTRGLAMSSREKIMVENMAKWDNVYERAQGRGIQFPEDPYLPMRLFFERRGTLRFERGFLAFEGAMLPLKPIHLYKSLHSLNCDQRQLDQLDAAQV